MKDVESLCCCHLGTYKSMTGSLPWTKGPVCEFGCCRPFTNHKLVIHFVVLHHFQIVLTVTCG